MTLFNHGMQHLTLLYMVVKMLVVQDDTCPTNRPHFVAGLGQLHSPSVTAAFAAHYSDSRPPTKPQEVAVSGQQW